MTINSLCKTRNPSSSIRFPCVFLGNPSFSIVWPWREKMPFEANKLITCFIVSYIPARGSGFKSDTTRIILIASNHCERSCVSPTPYYDSVRRSTNILSFIVVRVLRLVLRSSGIWSSTICSTINLSGSSFRAISAIVSAESLTFPLR